MEAKPLIVIVGPTASGKTGLAIELAQKYGAEIICADSRTVYKGMDIGTAKPSKDEQMRVSHWGLDLVNPDERFTAADFKNYADEKIQDIRSRGKVPFLVGGTGLYIDSVIFDYQFGEPIDKEIRQQFEQMSLEELYIYCEKNNVKLPENYKNKRYVIRAIEQKNDHNKKLSGPLPNTIIVGITTDIVILKNRIGQRAEQLFQDGVVEEAKKLGNKYGWDHESMTSNIYPLCKKYLQGELTISEVKEKFLVLDWHLAKRQLTWLKRNKWIKWMTITDAKSYIAHVLASEQ